MNEHIPESDWKRWRKLSETALERYCAYTLREVAKFATGNDSAHARYGQLWQLLREHDRTIGDVFDNPRRSTALIQIAVAVKERIITRDELTTFSEETRARIKILLGEGEA